ncbi:MAG: hypothetical protein HUJ79_02975, partial [Firmicutes bacterium]|nr:hypothetical protein [Bacillota bacterium]
MESKKKFPITNIGTVTLLMIFIVICMVVFTVLTLSKSAADYNFTKKLATQTTAYYDACSQAEALRAQAENELNTEAQTRADAKAQEQAQAQADAVAQAQAQTQAVAQAAQAEQAQ